MGKPEIHVEWKAPNGPYYDELNTNGSSIGNLLGQSGFGGIIRNGLEQ